MKIIELRTFLEIASLKGFSKAAMSLNYAQSSVTAQIKSLEEHLDVKLFRRDNKSVTLTSDGERLYGYARKIIDLSHEAKIQIRNNGVSGTIKIAAVETISTYRLPAILKKFRQIAPDAQIEFKIMRDKEMQDSVRRGTIDFGFWVGEELVIQDVEVLRLCREPVSLYAPPDHPLADTTITPKMLSIEHHLLWAPDCCYSLAFHRAMHKAGYHDFSYMEFSNTETMKKCTLSGLGISTLTDITATKELQAGELTRLNFSFTENFFSFVFWNKYRVNTPVYQNFIQTVRQHYSLL